MCCVVNLSNLGSRDHFHSTQSSMPSVEGMVVIWELFFIAHFLQSISRKLSFNCKETWIAGIVFSRAKAFLGIRENCARAENVIFSSWAPLGMASNSLKVVSILVNAILWPNSLFHLEKPLCPKHLGDPKLKRRENGFSRLTTSFFLHSSLKSVQNC